MLDHDEDSYEKISSTFLDGNVTGRPAPVVDKITLYSSGRLYWENFCATFEALAGREKAGEAFGARGVHGVPSEIFQAPRSWAEKVYPNLIYFNEAAEGGHFAAWEESRRSSRASCARRSIHCGDP
jgi:hypothetical protein